MDPWVGRSLEEGMAAPSSLLAWRIPWTEEPGGLPSMGLQSVRHDRGTEAPSPPGGLGAAESGPGVGGSLCPEGQTAGSSPSRGPVGRDPAVEQGAPHPPCPHPWARRGFCEARWGVYLRFIPWSLHTQGPCETGFLLRDTSVALAVVCPLLPLGGAGASQAVASLWPWILAAHRLGSLPKASHCQD